MTTDGIGPCGYREIPYAAVHFGQLQVDVLVRLL